MNHQPKNGPLYIHIAGRLFLITATAQSQDEANSICLRDHTESVIDTMGPLVLLAKHADKGIAFKALYPLRFNPSQGAEHAFNNPSRGAL